MHPNLEVAMSVYPYLMFTGTCREAMTLYQDLLGGQLDVMTMADAPPDAQAPGADADMVMHAALTFGDGGMLMASDDPSGDGSGVKGCALSLTFGTEAEVHRVFDGLAAGGEVDMPLGPTFWSSLFGMCRDRFGVSWMVGIDHPAD